MGRFSRDSLRSVGSAATLAAFMAVHAPASAQNASVSNQPVEAESAIPEIIVTAERRAESLQRSSLSLQVLGAAELERSNMTQISDLNTMAPGVQIGTGGNAPQIYIRGVGDFAASALSNPAVAVNIDGVYVARPQAINSLFYDVERIEAVERLLHPSSLDLRVCTALLRRNKSPVTAFYFGFDDRACTLAPLGRTDWLGKPFAQELL